MRVLWTWHAIEETEHRAVVYDVYLKNGGSYAHRIAWYLYVSVIFTLESMVQTLVNLKNSGNLFSLSCWRKGLPFLFGQRGIFLNLLRPWLAYLTPGYYPDDRHSAPKRVEWLERHKQWFKA
jgi:predicted metal-dependent hydrolase